MVSAWAMQLYYSLTSPYARKVRILLLEKGLSFEGINVAQSERQASEHNPLGKIPTLVLDDGTELFDSTVITETLDALYPSPRLIPLEVRSRAIVRRWEALADGLCDVLVPVLLDLRRPAEVRDTAYSLKLENKVKTVLRTLENFLVGKSFLHDDQYSLADVAVVSALGYVNLRRPELLSGHPEIERYVAEQLRRPSHFETVPPNVPMRL